MIAYIRQRLTGSDLERFEKELAEKSTVRTGATLVGDATTDASVKALNAWLKGWLDRLAGD